MSDSINPKEIAVEEESNLVSYARSELARIRGPEPDELQDAVDKHIIEMVRLFASEGHSGTSAPYCISILEKLLRFEPLTGDDDEWNEVGDGYYQNRRCSHVFKENGEVYDSQGRVFREPDGSCFLSRDSRVPVTFPYVPTREYVDRP